MSYSSVNYTPANFWSCCVAKETLVVVCVWIRFIGVQLSHMVVDILCNERIARCCADTEGDRVIRIRRGAGLPGAVSLGLRDEQPVAVAVQGLMPGRSVTSVCPADNAGEALGP